MIARLIALCLLSLSFNSQANSPEPLVPGTEHALTNRAVVHHLYQHHYARKYINDDFSSTVFDSYISSLDPTRSYFTADDIKDFEKDRKNLDDAIKRNELDIAYKIYNRYEQRLVERLTYAVALLKKGTEQFNFKINESIDLDREKAPWAKDTAELDDLWRKRIKSAVLNLKLANKPDKDIKDLLLKRYESQLTRIEQVNSEDAFQTYMNAITASFDPHTQYMSPRNSENFNINMSLSLQGIGAVLRSENENTVVESLVTAGPADKTGLLHPSDKIIGVAQDKDGPIVNVIGWRLDEVVDLIRGPKGSLVRLEIIPGSSKTDESKIIPIVRDEVKLEDRAAQKDIITIKRDGKDFKLGVIDIPAFYADFEGRNANKEDYRSTTRDVSRLINELKTQGINGLVIDLRNNGGGSLEEVNNLVGLFIDKGPTVQVHYSFGHTQVLEDENPGTLYDGPLMVVTNRLSASASEIFAGAIQDYGRGVIVGSQTFGKGTVQTLIPLFRGQLKVTNAKFYRISGESTQHRGVLPDIAYPEIYDTDKIGESALPEALPWDQIKAANYKLVGDIKPLLPILRANHNKRVASNPDFIYLNEQLALLKRLRDETLVSLNMDKRKQEREALEKDRLTMENKRRKAKGMPLLDHMDSIDDEDMEPSENDKNKKDKEPDAQLQESGEIMLDYISLKNAKK